MAAAPGIGALLERDAAAWNRADLESQIALYHSEAELVMPGGQVLHGREQIRSAIAEAMKAAGMVTAAVGDSNGTPVLVMLVKVPVIGSKRMGVLEILETKEELIYRAELFTNPEKLKAVRVAEEGQPGATGEL